MDIQPTIRSASVLYLLTMLLIVTVGAFVQARALAWGVLATEFILILIPTLLFLRLRRLPFRQTLRWQWPGWRLAGLSLLIGAGAWLLDSWLDELTATLFGYTTPTPPAFFPTTPASALLLFAALALSAPLCEEILFRGYMQKAFERWGGWASVFITAVLFAFYHQRFQGLFALLPVSLALSWVVWRSHSLIPGILVHFANNALGAGFLLFVTAKPDMAEHYPAAGWAGLGVVILIIGLWLFHRQAPATAIQPTLSTERKAWLRQAWPLLLTIPIYLFSAAGELILGLYPQLMAFGRDLEFEAAPWAGPYVWRYEIQDPTGHKIGGADCHLTPLPTSIRLECQADHIQFEIRHKEGTSIVKPASRQWSAEWQPQELRLLSAAGHLENEDGIWKYSLKSDNDGLILTIRSSDGREEEITLPETGALSDEWPWRFSALPLDLAYSRPVQIAWPITSGKISASDEPIAKRVYVTVRGAEPVSTPAGPFVAWRVTLSDLHTVWYDVNAPHTLIRYEDGVFTYLLAR